MRSRPRNRGASWRSGLRECKLSCRPQQPFQSVTDPVGLEFVTSLARPGGNVLGLTSTPGAEFYGKRLELLRELAPGAARIALLVTPGTPTTAERVRRRKPRPARL